MASAYVALLSLNSTIEQHPFTFPEISRQEIESLKEKSYFLIDFFEKHHNSQISRKEILDLEILTKQVALLAGCMIDCHAMDQMLVKKHGYCSGKNSSKLFPDELIHQIFKDSMKLMTDVTANEEALLSTDDVPPTSPSVTGFGHHLIAVMKCFESMKEIAMKIMMDLKSDDAPVHPSAPSRGVENKATMVVFDQHLIAVMKCFESIKEIAMKISRDVASSEAQLSTTVLPSTPPGRCVDINTSMVGFDEHLRAVKDRITGHASTLQILPIVGTGGIGKTTLAQNVYDDQLIKDYFDIRSWATISQTYNVQAILSSFLHDLNILTQQSGIYELGEKLYKTLFGRRYLIVMDDIWDDKVWDQIRRFFPKNDNGSRIILTSRLQSVACHIGSCDPYKLDYLNQVESWNLLKRKVFGQDGCPSALEDIGREIAVSCKGLPLAIVVIAGHLAKSDITKESWKDVAGALISILRYENDGHCLKILSLSYDNLPIHLKPGFLYMAFFRKGSVLRVSNIIKLWAADGFIKPTGDQCSEDTAMEYLTELVERNLISVSKRGSSGKMKCFRVHDLLRDLCTNKSREHQYLYYGIVQNGPTLGNRTKSIITKLWADKGEYNKIPLSKFSLRCHCFNLSTSDWENNWDHQAADYNLRNFRLRYIQFSASQATDTRTFSTSLATISMFQNLETLSMKKMSLTGPVVLPPQIWNMSLFRHLLIKKVVLPDPPTTETNVTGKKRCVLANLQTLQDVYCLKLSDEVVKRIPNLKKLKMTYTRASETTAEWSYYCLHNLAQLRKLESLSFSVVRKISASEFSLPKSLRKLTLDGCKLPWEDMTMVCFLPQLEVLRLQNDAFCGKEWKSVEGEFFHFKVLNLQNMSLQQWEADSSHFPRLERLILYNVSSLKELPLSIGDTETLQFISAEFCRFSLELSIREIIVEQRSYGNDGIAVELPSVFILESANSFYIMQYVRYFIYNLLHCNNHPAPDETSVMIEKFEDNLRELQAFLGYTAKRERNDRQKELVKHIRDVMYEAVDIAYTVSLEVNKGKSLSYFFRRVLSVVKEVEYVSVRVQRLLLSVGDGLGQEGLGSYKDPPYLIDWKTDDEGYNFRFQHMINQHKHKLDPDWLKKNPEMEKYLEPVGDKSRIQLIVREFALLTDVDGISIENELNLNQEQISTVHIGYACDYCEMFPIVGVRYRCKDCVMGLGFDLCEDCYSSEDVSDHPNLPNDEKHTSDHTFEKILTSRRVGRGRR